MSDSEDSLADQLATIWLERAATRSPYPKENRIAALELIGLRGEVGVEEQGWRRAARNAVARVSKVRWFAPYGMGLAQRFVNKALTQVTDYFEREEIRTAALNRVLALLGANTKVLLGHSLGSIVAYEAAHKARYPIPLLLTIGSPLGLDTFVYPRLAPQPPTFPASVHRWVNVANPEDLIAAEPDLKGFFSAGLPPNGIFEGFYTVENGAKPHSAEFYLTKAQVGKPIAEALDSH